MNFNTFNNINRWLLGTASLLLSHIILKSFPQLSQNFQPLIIISSSIFVTTQDLKISITLTLLYHLYNNTSLKTLPFPSLTHPITKEPTSDNNSTQSDNDQSENKDNDQSENEDNDQSQS